MPGIIHTSFTSSWIIHEECSYFIRSLFISLILSTLLVKYLQEADMLWVINTVEKHCFANLSARKCCKLRIRINIWLIILCWLYSNIGMYILLTLLICLFNINSITNIFFSSNYSYKVLLNGVSTKYLNTTGTVYYLFIDVVPHYFVCCGSQIELFLQHVLAAIFHK